MAGDGYRKLPIVRPGPGALQMPGLIQPCKGFNPLSPKSDQHEIFPYSINSLENRVVMRIEYMIREDESV